MTLLLCNWARGIYLKETGTWLLVCGQHETISTQELADTTVFVARSNGKRSPVNRKVDLKQKQKLVSPGTQDAQNQSLSVKASKYTAT